MQWSEVTAAPPEKMLRQFAGLFLVFFLALAGWRVWNGHADVWAGVLGGIGVVVGVLGLIRPLAVRWIYTAWMVVAFPIGWTISRVALALIFYGIFTPVAAFFRAAGRDVLHLRRRSVQSYWSAKPRPDDVASYFRQS